MLKYTKTLAQALVDGTNRKQASNNAEVLDGVLYFYDKPVIKRENAGRYSFSLQYHSNTSKRFLNDMAMRLNAPIRFSSKNFDVFATWSCDDAGTITRAVMPQDWITVACGPWAPIKQHRLRKSKKASQQEDGAAVAFDDDSDDSGKVY